MEVTPCPTPYTHPLRQGAASAARRNRGLHVAADITLSAALTSVLDAWQELVARGAMSEQTLSRFGQLLRRFEAFATVRGVRLLTGVDATVAAQFIDAHGRTRHGRIAPASLSTRHLRRSVLRMCFGTARRLALTDTDPTRDIDLSRRCGSMHGGGGRAGLRRVVAAGHLAWARRRGQHRRRWRARHR
ncbi:hypothetical protein ACIG3E_33305 [Streptomyces sp. NPDC053474]|uniref:hypothetical protein n=1 Tax=Streptomyces sp. NPDC053474 TaxID=3365704 RepID=UPI0037D160A5